MMPGMQSIARVVLIVTGSLAIGVGALAFRPAAVPQVIRTASTARDDRPDSVTPERRRSMRMAVVADDPFRRNRAPSTTPYDGVRLEAARLAPPSPAVPRPVLGLSGIVWGRHPEALIDGVPGSDGSHLFHPGDTAGGLRVRVITREHVILAGMDTTWTLVIRRPAP